MVLGGFLSDTRRRWLKAFKLFKRSKNRSSLTSPRHNRVSPARGAAAAAEPYSGTVDAASEISVETFCRCSATPPFPAADAADSTYENLSYCSDSAYDTDRSSNASSATHRMAYATVTYYLKEGTKDSDTSSITTELTWLEVEVSEVGQPQESAQNVVNEKIELMTSL